MQMIKTKGSPELEENKDRFCLDVCEEIKVSDTHIFGVAVFKNKAPAYAFNNIKTNKDVLSCIAKAKVKLAADKVTGYY